MTTDDELLEVFDAAGRATGVAKTRAAVHRDGDWHLAFFCWIVRQDAGAGGPGARSKRSWASSRRAARSCP